MVTDATVYKNLDLGSDHRAVRITMNLSGRKKKKRKHFQSARNNKDWRADDLQRFNEILDLKVGDIFTENGLAMK
eukprot:3599823-Karenia_brevis.AAC.1